MLLSSPAAIKEDSLILLGFLVFGLQKTYVHHQWLPLFDQ